MWPRVVPYGSTEPAAWLTLKTTGGEAASSGSASLTAPFLVRPPDISMSKGFKFCGRPFLQDLSSARSRIGRPSNAPFYKVLQMAPSVLVKKFQCQHHKSSREIAEELSSSYGMPVTERHMNENIIRGMRAAQRQFCEHIRKNLAVTWLISACLLIDISESQSQLRRTLHYRLSWTIELPARHSPGFICWIAV